MATTRKFGIISNISGMQGGIMVNSIDTQQQVETAEARNETGEIVDMVGFSKAKTVSLSGVMDTAKGSLATAGSTITIDSKTLLIQSVQKTENNTDFVQVSISAKGADNAIITVINGADGSSSSSSQE